MFSVDWYWLFRTFFCHLSIVSAAVLICQKAVRIGKDVRLLLVDYVQLIDSVRGDNN